VAAAYRRVPFIGSIGLPWCVPALLDDVAELERRRGMEPGSATLVLYPDAGMLRNDNVLQHYLALGAQLRGAGRELLVGWWGQEAREGGDIDEYALAAAEGGPGAPAMENLTLEQFFFGKLPPESQRRLRESRHHPLLPPGGGTVAAAERAAAGRLAEWPPLRPPPAAPHQPAPSTSAAEAPSPPLHAACTAASESRTAAAAPA
jgi:hypothetical protein